MNGTHADAGESTIAPQCSKGWGERCAHGKDRRCRCRCGGLNHGKANPASAVHTQKRQAEMFDENVPTGQLDYRRDRKAMFYDIGEAPERSPLDELAVSDAREIIFRRGGGHHDDEAAVLVRTSTDTRTDLRRLEQRIRWHSDGFEFGYGGSGPADCALNILALVVSPKEAARLHQDFKSAFVARIPQSGGVLPMTTVRAWVADRYRAELADGKLMAREAELRALAAEIAAADAEAAAEGVE